MAFGEAFGLGVPDYVLFLLWAGEDLLNHFKDWLLELLDR